MRRRAMWLMLVGLAACSGPRFLGARIDRHCDDYRACRAWARSQIDRAALADYPDAELHDYVVTVLDRLARARGLATSPEVRITQGGPFGSSEPSGAIHLSRAALAAIDSEAELAALLAHELAHVGAGSAARLDETADPSWLTWKRDVESIADERAVGLLIAAGYAPQAMLTMLRAIAPGPDSAVDVEHPLPAQRLARVAAVIGDRAGGDLGQDRYRRHVDGLVLGVDPRLVTGADGIVVSLEVDVAIEVAHMWPESESVTATVVDTVAGDLVISQLIERRIQDVAGHVVVTGTVAKPVLRADPVLATSRGEALAAELDRWHQLADGTRVVIVRGSGRDLWLDLHGTRADTRVDALVQGIRKPSAAERARVVITRLRYRPAVIGGPYALASARTCQVAFDTASLDDAARIIRPGELIKCAIEEPIRAVAR